MILFVCLKLLLPALVYTYVHIRPRSFASHMKTMGVIEPGKWRLLVLFACIVRLPGFSTVCERFDARFVTMEAT